MKKAPLLFLDTETTDLEEPRLVQLAYKTKCGLNKNSLFKPPKAIDYGAMAIHHITQAMVENAQPFEGSEAKDTLMERLNKFVLVAHNAKFDIGVLKNEGVETKWHICTKRLAMHLMPDLESHSLQYLRYKLHLEFDQPINPHDAWSDILVLEALYDYLAQIISLEFNTKDDIEAAKKAVELTRKPIILKTFKFGKHKGKTFEEVRDQDSSYFTWLLRQDFVKEDDDLVYTINNLSNPTN